MSVRGEDAAKLDVRPEHLLSARPRSRPTIRSRTMWLHVVLGCFVVLNCYTFAMRAGVLARALVIPRYQDPVAGTERMLAEVIPFLPSHGIVGYVKPGFDYANADDLAGLYRAQYALVPRVVVNGTQPEFVVGVSRDGQTLPDTPPGFIQVRAFGTAVALYRRVR